MAINYCLQGDYQETIAMDGNGKDVVGGGGDIAAALRAGFDPVDLAISGGRAVNTPRADAPQFG